MLDRFVNGRLFLDDFGKSSRVLQNLDCLRGGKRIYVHALKIADAPLGLVHSLEQLGLDMGQNDVVIVTQLVAGPPYFKDFSGEITAVFGKAGDKIG